MKDAANLTELKQRCEGASDETGGVAAEEAQVESVFHSDL